MFHDLLYVITPGNSSYNPPTTANVTTINLPLTYGFYKPYCPQSERSAMQALYLAVSRSGVIVLPWWQDRR
jgi:hypothetical protein